MSFQKINLAALSPPQGVAVPTFQAILDARLAQFMTFYSQARAANPSLPAIDAPTLALVSDPANIHQRVDAFREVLVTQSINDAVLSTFLAWAQGASLDAFGASLGVARQTGELDASYQARLQLVWEAISIGGTYGRYTFNALSAAPVQLSGVAVHGAEVSPVPRGQVWIVCLGANSSGIPSADTLSLVTNATAPRGVRPVNDQVVVKPVNPANFVVKATLYLADGADPAAVLAAQSAALIAFLAARRTIGGVVKPGDVKSVLGFNPNGLVSDVDVRAPASNVGGDPFQAPICLNTATFAADITWAPAP